MSASKPHVPEVLRKLQILMARVTQREADMLQDIAGQVVVLAQRLETATGLLREVASAPEDVEGLAQRIKEFVEE